MWSTSRTKPARMREPPTAALSASAGKVSPPAVQRNPLTRGIRVDFLLQA